MQKRSLSADTAPAPIGGYAQAIEISGTTRRLYISGQIPETRDGTVPPGFAAQADLVWSHIRAQLQAAGMTTDNLVKVTTFLSDRRYADANGEARRAALGACSPALTVIITGIFDERWLLEIEAIAEA